MDLPELDPTAARLFLDYFRAEAAKHRKPFTFGCGLAQWDTEGRYVALQEGDVGQGPVTWRIVRSPEGSLVELVCLAESEALCQEAGAFVTRALGHAMNERTSTFFRREFFVYSGAALASDYRFGKRLRFAIRDQEPEQTRHLVNAERLVSIDQELEAVDDQHATALAREYAERLAARLSLLGGIGLRRSTLEHVLVLEVSNGTMNCVRRQRWNEASMRPNDVTTMPELEKGVRTVYRTTASFCAGYRDGLVSYPQWTARLLRAVDKDPALEQAFDGCARLFQLAAVTDHLSRTLSLACLVGGVEAICRGLGHGEGFSQFMRRQLDGQGVVADEGLDPERLDRILEWLYGDIRSAHFHAGKDPLIRSRPVDLFDLERTKLDSDGRAGYRLIWAAVSRWIVTEAAKSGEI